MIFSINIIFILIEIVATMECLLHQFLYNPMINECGWVCISTHKTPEGAEKAKESHRSEAYKDWLEEFPTEELRMTHPFGKNEDWRTGITVLMD